MKSKMNKILMLSLSAVLIAGATGCERKGRAPLKANVAAGDGISAVADETGTGKLTTPTTDLKLATPTADSSKPNVSLKEEDLLVESQISGCKLGASAFNIDAYGPNTIDNLKSDFETIAAFRACMEGNGIVVTSATATGATAWKLLSATKSEEGTPAWDEFNKQVSIGKTDDYALKVMGSRLELSILIFKKMIAKYDTHLKADETFLYAQKPVTVEKALKNIAGIASALTAGEKDFASYRTVKDGLDGAKKSDIAPDDKTKASE